MTKRRRLQVAIALVLAGLSLPVCAQSGERPTHVPNRPQPNGPFGTDWAKPGGTTGSYIYDDPRLPDPYHSSRRGARHCPAPLLYDVAKGRCR